jgi:hypothetical protein
MHSAQPVYGLLGGDVYSGPQMVLENVEVAIAISLLDYLA